MEAITGQRYCAFGHDLQGELSVFFQQKIGTGIFGGEGLFHTRITGPGRVYLQSIPVCNTAQVLYGYMSGSSSNEKGINIGFGDSGTFLFDLQKRQ